MSRHLQNEIEKLKKRILHLGAMVERALDRAAEAVMTRDADVARSVIEADSEVDRIEVDVEEECLKILALHQPVAADLRYVVAVLKINNDLERVGDLAANIAERAEFLASRSLPPEARGLPAMVEAVRDMLRRSLDSLVKMDSRLAREVLDSDSSVDDMNRKMFELVQEAIRARPSDIGTLILLQSVSRYLERIADHATNVAEDVIYMLEGEIARHGSAKKTE
ncbi:MAG: phosphate signaling complex protein PhoU [Candidatus Eisenbacteria bacterium]|nr:phosphate signaling complex protein PhoU [Candidatus Eisenbacteria bacterium]